jgi:hypothetical protein
MSHVDMCARSGTPALVGARPEPSICRHAACRTFGAEECWHASRAVARTCSGVRVLCGTPALTPRAGSRGAAVDAVRDYRAPGARHHAGYGVGDAGLAPTIIEWARVPSARRSKAVVAGRLEGRFGMLICSWRSKRYASPEVSGTPGQTQNSLPSGSAIGTNEASAGCPKSIRRAPSASSSVALASTSLTRRSKCTRVLDVFGSGRRCKMTGGCAGLSGSNRPYWSLTPICGSRARRPRSRRAVRCCGRRSRCRRWALP